MLRYILVFILLTFPAIAKDSPDFSSLKKSWGKLDSMTITKSAGLKYRLNATKGKDRISRDLYMISPEKPEMFLWIFPGYKPDYDPYKQSPEIFISTFGLKELSSWYNTLVVIVDSGASLYAYNPNSGLPELQIYSTIYDTLCRQYGIVSAVLVGVSSGAEGAVKFSPFVRKLNSLICISGIYDYDSLSADSDEYKIHVKEYGSPVEWKYEQPKKIFPSLKCKIVLLSEEESVYRLQAEAVGRLQGKKNIKFMQDIGKGKSHDWDFWGSDEVKKVLYAEIQAAGEN